MGLYAVTYEAIVEKTVTVEAKDEAEATYLADMGRGEIVNEEESSWPTIIHVTELEDDN